MFSLSPRKNSRKPVTEEKEVIHVVDNKGLFLVEHNGRAYKFAMRHEEVLQEGDRLPFIVGDNGWRLERGG